MSNKLEWTLTNFNYKLECYYLGKSFFYRSVRILYSVQQQRAWLSVIFPAGRIPGEGKVNSFTVNHLGKGHTILS